MHIVRWTVLPSSLTTVTENYVRVYSFDTLKQAHMFIEYNLCTTPCEYHRYKKDNATERWDIFGGKNDSIKFMEIDIMEVCDD